MDYEDQTQIVREWFTNHIATMKSDDTLVWKKPDRITCSITYIHRVSTLIVIGDLGSAVYQWSARNDIEWISRCGLSYFHGKCEASEDGRIPRTFDADLCRREIVKHMRLSRIDFPKDGVAKEQLHEMCDEHDWYQWLREHGNEVLGPDCFELAGVGKHIPIRTIAHLEGLKMAMDQLKQDCALCDKPGAIIDVDAGLKVHKACFGGGPAAEPADG